MGHTVIVYVLDPKNKKHMSIIEIIYISASVISICGSLPQIKQLLITKRTEELSMITWSIWTVSQVVAMCYAISIHATLLIFTNALWMTFYGLMIVLIFHYRSPRMSTHTFEFIDIEAMDETIATYSNNKF